MGSEQKQWKRQSNVTFRRYDVGGILIDQSRGEVFEANELGALIWDLLAEPHTTAEIVESLAAEFDEPIPELSGDTESYLKALHEHNLIVPEE